MVQILNTTGLNYHVEQTIANAEERIILISPYLKLSARIKELIEDKNRMTLIRKKIRNRKKMFRNHPQKVTIKLTYLLMIKPLIWMTAQAKTMKLMPSLQIN